MTFTIFDRDALGEVKKDSNVYRHAFNQTDNRSGKNYRMPHMDHTAVTDANMERFTKPETPHYSDEIPPFNVVITFQNEYGNASKMTIYGVEFTNEGAGFSVDDITSEKAMSFVARAVDDMSVDRYSRLTRND